MADIKPFRAIRPARELAEHIAALPYDVYDRGEAKAETEREPLSFLRIDRAETQLPDETDMYDEIVYRKARELLWDMVEKGQLVTEERECYYVYELVMDGRSQTGIAACASVDDYISQVIKKHENTRADKEEDRVRHVDVCGAQTGPIFLAYRSRQEINELVKKVMEREPLYDFTAGDGVRHRVFPVDRDEEIEGLRKAFSAIEEIYIADGHHRCASAVRVALRRREEKGTCTGREEFNYFLSVLFPDDQLMIMDYNRVLLSLNGYTPETLLGRLDKDFQVEKSDRAVKPEKKGVFGLCLEGGWYRLEAREHLRSSDAVDGLDVSLLQTHVLEPVFGITDPKTDKRIDFVGGIRGLGELEKRVRTDAKAAFSLYPTSIEELFAVADAGRLMPPKSTWFEPKLRSGLFIHGING